MPVKCLRQSTGLYPFHVPLHSSRMLLPADNCMQRPCTAWHLQSWHVLLPAEVCCARVGFKEWKAVTVACAVYDGISALQRLTLVHQAQHTTAWLQHEQAKPGAKFVRRFRGSTAAQIVWVALKNALPFGGQAVRYMRAHYTRRNTINLQQAALCTKVMQPFINPPFPGAQLLLLLLTCANSTRPSACSALTMPLLVTFLRGPKGFGSDAHSGFFQLRAATMT